MGLRSRLFALVYDRQMAKTDRGGLRARREAQLAGVAGDVLEIGAGTGLNLSIYGHGIASLTLTEPEPPMLKRLRKRAAELAPTATVLRAPAEDLPFGDATFDVVISTLVLCGVSDQPRALREIHRVLRPNGELRFVEHVRSDNATLARKQDRMNAVNRFVVGCDCNRSTLQSIADAGFEIRQVDRGSLPEAPEFCRPLVAGTATAVPGHRYGDPSSHSQSTRA
jgi:ubiquinone/menaquinone biosynthesis C-methylase UbiE